MDNFKMGVNLSHELEQAELRRYLVGNRKKRHRPVATEGRHSS